ncbi:MAG: transposase [Elusimicrobia bacterium]|nr:transposase [Elusimicrobiota bacterium]
MKFRKHIRLKDYDYKTNGYYFVTLVTWNKLPLLKNCSGECKLAIKDLPKFISGLSIDWFVVMNDHIHIIFVLDDCNKTLGQVVRALKYNITKNVAVGLPSNQIKANSNSPATIWQWNYYEHIIRNEKALSKIREYIQNNPDIEQLNWDELERGIIYGEKENSCSG